MIFTDLTRAIILAILVLIYWNKQIIMVRLLFHFYLVIYI